jgi:hypothetical protein
MMILIAGPYRGGTNDDPVLIKKNLDKLDPEIKNAGAISCPHLCIKIRPDEF